MFDVLCVGSATVDRFLNVDQPLKSVKLGDKVLVKSLEIHTGGGATNSAAALSKLGLKVKALTKLGNDHDADFILKELKQFKVKNICLNKSKKKTNFSSIISSGGDRVIYAYKGASRDLNLNDFKKRHLKARWIYLASLMDHKVSEGIAAYAHMKKIKLLFNPSLYLAQKGKKYLSSVLQATNILVLNKKEARALLNTKENSLKKLILQLSALGPETVVITQGKKQLVGWHKGKLYSLIPPKVKVIHTAGAGDAFTAGLLAGIIKKYDFKDALKLGQVNANSVIQHIGTKNKLLTMREALKLMKRYKINVIKN